MSDDMCQPRSVIIENDPQLQKAIRELEKLQQKEGNGNVRKEMLEYEMIIENRINAQQTQQDVSSIRETLEKIDKRLQIQNKFPSFVYQLMKLPLMGWSVVLGNAIGCWLIAQIPPEWAVRLLNAAHIDATIADVHVVSGFVMASMFVIAARRYVKLVNECEEADGLDLPN